MEVDQAEVVHLHANHVGLVVVWKVLVGHRRDEGAGAGGRLARSLVLLVLQQGVQIRRTVIVEIQGDPSDYAPQLG